jgi:hypothetical protein
VQLVQSQQPVQSQPAQPQPAQPQPAQPQPAQPQPAQPQYAQPQYAQPQYAQPQLPRSPNGALLEVVRRVVAMVLFVLGVAAILFEPEKLFVVEALDWSDEYAKEDNSDVPISQFVNDRLDLRFQTATDPAWNAIRAEVLEAPARSGKPLCKIFAHDHPLLAGNQGIILVQQGLERRYLRVSEQDLDNLRDVSAPLSLQRPYLFYGPPMTVFALLSYLLIRWKRSSTPIHYKPYVTALIDLIGFALLGLGGLLVARAAQDSWSSVATLFVLVSMIGLSLLLPSAYFTAKRAAVLTDRVRVFTLFGQTDFPFDRISTSFTRREAQAPILGIVLIVLGITNLASAVIGVVMLVRKDLRFTLRRDDGKTFSMWVRSANGVEMLTQSLVANGVKHESF